MSKPKKITKAGLNDLTKRVQGLSVKEADNVLFKSGFEVRVAERNGKQIPLTAEYDPHRANLSVVDDKVESVLSIG